MFRHLPPLGWRNETYYLHEMKEKKKEEKFVPNSEQQHILPKAKIVFFSFETQYTKQENENF